MQQKTIFVIISLVLISLLSFIFFWPDDKLHLIACDVGQGDAILITKGFNQVLIDGGPNDRVLGCLARNMPFWDRNIEIVVNTHPDKDHLSGLVSVIQRYETRYLVINSIAVESKLFNQFHQLVREKKIRTYSPQQGEEIKLAGIDFKVLWPEEKTENLAFWQDPLPKKESVLGASVYTKDVNEASITLLLDYGDFEALLTGDITAEEEKKIIDYCQYENCGESVELLKVAHHGSKTSTSQELVEFFEPKIAIISVGENSWGHPVPEVLEKLRNIDSRILRTDQLGDVKISTNGRRIYYK